MKTQSECILPVVLLCVALIVASGAEKQRSSFWAKLLKFTGISASPGQMKGADEDLETGELWLTDLTTGQRKKLSEELGFRSPVFSPDGKAVLLVRSNQLCQLQLGDGASRKLLDAPGVSKLIGFNREATNELCLLVSSERGWEVQSISLPDGAVTRIPYDPDSQDDRRLLTHLKDWVREYEPNLSVYPAKQTKISISGRTVAWNDILLKRGDAPPANISQSGGYDCSQPSLSPDATKVVYLKAVSPN